LKLILSRYGCPRTGRCRRVIIVASIDDSERDIFRVLIEGMQTSIPDVSDGCTCCYLLIETIYDIFPALEDDATGRFDQ
jgi:hypothetical protein